MAPHSRTGLALDTQGPALRERGPGWGHRGRLPPELLWNQTRSHVQENLGCPAGLCDTPLFHCDSRLVISVLHPLCALRSPTGEPAAGPLATWPHRAPPGGDFTMAVFPTGGAACLLAAVGPASVSWGQTEGIDLFALSFAPCPPTRSNVPSRDLTAKRQNRRVQSEEGLRPPVGCPCP